MSDVDHHEAQHQHHAQQGAHDRGVGVCLHPGGHGAGHGRGRLMDEQVFDVIEGAVVWQRVDGKDVAHERVKVDGAHGGLDVILAESRTSGHEQGLHAVQGVVVAVVPHWRERGDKRGVCRYTTLCL